MQALILPQASHILLGECEILLEIRLLWSSRYKQLLAEWESRVFSVTKQLCGCPHIHLELARSFLIVIFNAWVDSSYLNQDTNGIWTGNKLVINKQGLNQQSYMTSALNSSSQTLITKVTKDIPRSKHSNHYSLWLQATQGGNNMNRPFQDLFTHTNKYSIAN